jgi:hypothetical protein
VASQALRRVVAPTVAIAVMTSAVAIAVNLATEWKHNLWAWLAVAAFTLLTAGVTLWLHHRQVGDTSEPRNGIGPVVNNSFIGRDNIQIDRTGGDVNVERDR